MNFNLVNDLYLFKLLLNQNNPTAVWLILPGLRNKKNLISVIYIYIYIAGKISIEHVTTFLNKYISKGAVDMKFSPDVGNNPSNLYIQRKQNK